MKVFVGSTTLALKDGFAYPFSFICGPVLEIHRHKLHEAASKQKPRMGEQAIRCRKV